MASLRTPSFPKPTGVGIANLRPRLRMANGGMFDGLRRAIGMAPPESLSEKYARQDAERAAKNPPPQAAPAQAEAPVMQLRNYGAGSADARMKALGLRNGGSPAINCGEGGPVPGSGEGDKIPAKYEPGEFVVSNDMLDAAPSLRGELHSLRTAVLAKKGMTPEEADAKAVQGDGLRAQFGYDPLGNRTGELHGQNNQGLAASGPTSTGGTAGGSGSGVPGAGVVGVQGGATGGDGAGFSDLAGQFMPRTQAGLRSTGAEMSQAVNQGRYAKAVGKFATGSLGLAKNVADDVLGGAVRGAYGVLRNPVEDFGRGALGMEDRVEPAAPQPSTAPYTPSSAAFNPAARVLRQGAKPVPASDEGIQEPQQNITVTKQPNGVTSFSGRDITGTNLSYSDGRKSNPIGIVPGMSKELIESTLRNPDGSRWSAGDNATMAANLRDGVDPYRGTSRQPQQDPLDSLRALAMNPMAIGSGRAARLLAAAEHNQTLRRGQDMQSADQRYNAEVTRQSKLREVQYNMEKDQRDYAAQRGDKAFEQQQQAKKAMDERIQGQFVDPEGKPDLAGAADFKKSITATLATLAKEAAARGDKAAAARLSKGDYSQMDSEDEAAIWDLYRNKQASRKNAGLLGGNFADSQDLTAYRAKGVKTNTLSSDEIEFNNGSTLHKNDAQQRKWLGMSRPHSSEFDRTMDEAERRQQQRNQGK